MKNVQNYSTKAIYFPAEARKNMGNMPNFPIYLHYSAPFSILDDIGNSVALIEKYFPDAKVVDCTRLTLGDRTRIVMSKFVNMSFNAVFLKNLLSSKSNRE